MRFERETGITPSEKILADLCDRSFMALWTYPNLYRKPAKELCDALVVFGNDVIIFSDKCCTYPNSGDAQLDWSRWYRRSIADSAQQLSRAEGWIKKCPDRVFLDRKCTNILPIQIPPVDRMRVYRVCVAIGASKRSKAETGKTALSISTDVEDDAQPFTVGRITKAKGWLHVFDENTLPILLSELSTISDFLDYLREKEALFDSGNFTQAEHELDLLAYYLWNDRSFPNPANERFMLESDLWDRVASDPHFLAGREENKISYFWDRLIEHLTDLYMREDLEIGNDMSVVDHERLVRIMAAEHRFGRRILAKWVLERAELAPDAFVGSLLESSQPDVLYVLLIGPGSDRDTHAEYRKSRSEELHVRCISAKAVQPDRRHVIGIAMDARGVRGGSEDFIYLDTIDWDENTIRNAEKLRQELGYFIEGKARASRIVESEYPGT